MGEEQISLTVYFEEPFWTGVFEKIENGVQVLLVDINAGKITQNGRSHTDDVQNLLK